MIELKQLQYLVTCADLHSFSRAAEALYTTQPNVSKVIKSLEEELGLELFQRQNRGIQLTPKGKQIYEYACKVLEHIQQLSEIADTDMKDGVKISPHLACEHFDIKV